MPCIIREAPRRSLVIGISDIIIPPHRKRWKRARHLSLMYRTCPRTGAGRCRYLGGRGGVVWCSTRRDLTMMSAEIIVAPSWSSIWVDEVGTTRRDLTSRSGSWLPRGRRFGRTKLVLLGENWRYVGRDRRAKMMAYLLGEDGDDYLQPQYWVYKELLYIYRSKYI